MVNVDVRKLTPDIDQTFSSPILLIFVSIPSMKATQLATMGYKTVVSFSIASACAFKYQI